MRPHASESQLWERWFDGVASADHAEVFEAADALVQLLAVLDRRRSTGLALDARRRMRRVEGLCGRPCVGGVGVLGAGCRRDHWWSL